LCYTASHEDDQERARLEKALRDAEAELDAARTLTAVKAAAKKVQRAKAELKELEGRQSGRRGGRQAHDGNINGFATLDSLYQPIILIGM
jgi:hypothetical protein